MTDEAASPGPSTPARVVLVESSSALPGLLPFPAWDALARAEVVLVRDIESHPSASHLYYAGMDLEQLVPERPAAGGMDLMRPGSPTDRGLATALLDRAEELGPVVYLLGPGDEGFGRVVGVEAAKRHVELEFVFLAELPPGTELLRLVQVMRRLRDPERGCPWDLEQDHRSLATYLVEETYELLDAIDRGHDLDLREELGDVLLQVVFHAQIAADRRAFTIDQVAAGIADKLERRHPHVFGDVDVADAEEVKANWDQLKAAEKSDREGPFEGVPMALPALQLMHDLQRKGAKLGFRWADVEGPAAKLREELDEALAAQGAEEREQEVGDLLAAAVAVARHLDVDPEAALRRAARRFRTRYEGMLELAAERGQDPATLDAEAWLGLWAEAKARHG